VRRRRKQRPLNDELSSRAPDFGARNLLFQLAQKQIAPPLVMTKRVITKAAENMVTIETRSRLTGSFKGKTNLWISKKLVYSVVV
jgi:hypothetical protein